MSRVGDDVRAARMLFDAGVSPASIFLYPLRRRLPPRETRIDLRDGTSITGPADEPLLFLFREIWIDRTYDRVAEIGSAPCTIVDIGAHVGLFSVWAAARCPNARIVAVEASPRAARYLRGNVARNRLDRVTVVEAACGGSRRRAVLHRRGAEMMSSLYGARSLGSSAATDGVEVEVITLEDVFRAHGIDRCDLLKLDCEGAEYEIILEASAETLDRVRRIVMECHRGGAATPLDLERHLAERGFDVRRTPAPDGIHEYLSAVRREPVVPATLMSIDVAVPAETAPR